MKIVVDIERLILDGLGTRPGEVARIRKTLERELVKTLSARPTREYHGGAVPRLNAPDILVSVGERPEATGARIGQAIGRSLVGGYAVERRGGLSEAGGSGSQSERGSELVGAGEMGSVTEHGSPQPTHSSSSLAESSHE